MLANFENINQRIQVLRETNRRRLNDCAAILGITTEDYAEMESGRIVPSLPQIELLATFFNLPSDKFLFEEHSSVDVQLSILNEDIRHRFIDLRNKMICAALKEARENKQISLEDIHLATQIPINQLEAYENSKRTIPIDHLIKFTSYLEWPFDAFIEKIGLSEEIEKDKLKKEEWEPAYPISKAEIAQDETDPDHILITAMRKIPKKAQAQIAKIILNNLKT